MVLYDRQYIYKQFKRNFISKFLFHGLQCPLGYWQENAKGIMTRKRIDKKSEYVVNKGYGSKIWDGILLKYLSKHCFTLEQCNILFKPRVWGLAFWKGMTRKKISETWMTRNLCALGYSDGIYVVLPAWKVQRGHLVIRLSVCLSVRPFVCPSVCMSVFLSRLRTKWGAAVTKWLSSSYMILGTCNAFGFGLLDSGVARRRKVGGHKLFSRKAKKKKIKKNKKVTAV